MYRIFLVEDDAVIASAVKRHLEIWGCEVGCAADFSNVLAEFESFSPQLVLLDISLPFYNGYHWCSEIRRVSDVPVMFISAASDSMNIVMAMNMGADDFIAKPFDLDVLTAKIQALMRRVYGPGEARNVIERGGAVLDPGAGTLSAGGGSVELTKNELRILKTLMESRGNRQPRRADAQPLENGQLRRREHPHRERGAAPPEAGGHRPFRLHQNQKGPRLRHFGMTAALCRR